MTPTDPSTGRAPAPVSIIIKAGLIAGALDISLAFLYGYLKGAPYPAAILKYISKTAFGKTTFSDPSILIITGLLVHFIIAMAWAIIFFILYRRLKLVKQNKIVTGIVYGLLVWTIMNLVVLPLWNNKAFVFKAADSTINAVILIVAIGLPLSFIAHKYYSKKIIHPLNLPVGRQDKFMVTVDTFRQMALSLPDAIELPHFDRTSFRVNLPGRQAGKRIFATMDEEKKIAVLMFSLLEQSVFCSFDKNIIYPVPGGWGRQGATIFELSKIKKAMMKDALDVVYREVLAKKKK